MATTPPITPTNDVPEQRTAPTELEAEAAYAESSALPEAAEVLLGPAAFEEGTFRVPVRGEEVVLSHRIVPAGEIVVWKERTVRRGDVAGSVRRERVETKQFHNRT